MNLLDPNQWANPKAGKIILDALLSKLPEIVFCDYRASNMSARELAHELMSCGYLGEGYYTYALTDDRGWLRVTLDLEHTKGASVCSFGFLDNRVEEISNPFFTRWMGQGNGTEHYNCFADPKSPHYCGKEK